MLSRWNSKYFYARSQKMLPYIRENVLQWGVVCLKCFIIMHDDIYAVKMTLLLESVEHILKQ